jgi:hypothetical protein
MLKLSKAQYKQLCADCADTVDDAEAPPTVPQPDDTDAQDPSPFTGAPGTGFDGTASTAQSQNRPKFNQRVSPRGYR